MEIKNKNLKYITKYEKLKQIGGFSNTSTTAYYDRISGLTHLLRNDVINNVRTNIINMGSDLDIAKNQISIKYGDNIPQELNSLIENCILVGLRADDIFGSPQVDQPIFYSNKTKEFFQIETGMLTPTSYVNVVPLDPIDNGTPRIDNSLGYEVHTFAWSAGTQLLNTAGTAATEIASVAAGIGTYLLDMSMPWNSQEWLVQQPDDNLRFTEWLASMGPNFDLAAFLGGMTGGVRLDNFLLDIKLINPPQIGGSVKN